MSQLSDDLWNVISSALPLGSHNKTAEKILNVLNEHRFNVENDSKIHSLIYRKLEDNSYIKKKDEIDLQTLVKFCIQENIYISKINNFYEYFISFPGADKLLLKQLKYIRTIHNKNDIEVKISIDYDINYEEIRITLSHADKKEINSNNKYLKESLKEIRYYMNNLPLPEDVNIHIMEEYDYTNIKSL